ncbi:PadR family transcriptional regulator [Paracoccus methylarcula]|uniref:PadR family transcriptional regulator n=1 Tax=Paracoccus methylarcula TaxID=72022 RepID=A0A422QX58_9RHOB|nr:PadR family transcriptional regulator [Paracoccus methylarcula]
METPEHRDPLSGLVRLHVLHHATEHEIYGQWMIDELASHGYRLSPDTPYPMLHKMERDGYLTYREERNGRAVRKLHAITGKGRRRPDTRTKRPRKGSARECSRPFSNLA